MSRGTRPWPWPLWLLLLLLTTACPGLTSAAQLELKVEPVSSLKEAFPNSKVRSTQALARGTAGFDLYRVSFKSGFDRVVGVLGIPKGAKGKVPVVVMVHGLGRDKSDMFALYGKLAAGEGLAILSLDLPNHGERAAGGGRSAASLLLPMTQGVKDVRRAADAIEELAGRFPLDPERIGYLGYSLGSFVGLKAVSKDQRFRVVVFNVLGDGSSQLGGGRGGLAGLLETARSYKPRPTLMLNGKHDQIVSPEGSRRLYDALPEPKSIVWYDSGHLLPPEALERAVEFLASELKSVGPLKEEQKERGLGLPPRRR